MSRSIYDGVSRLNVTPGCVLVCVLA